MDIGNNVGGYVVVGHIDDGGMGYVFKVEKAGVLYALKTCIYDGEDYKKRFAREVRLMKKLCHPNVIEVIDEGEYGGMPYFIMPLCDESLSKAVKRGINEDEKFDYLRQFCNGVKALHDVGEIHRDIKPGNALLLSGVVKVSDLGLGKFRDRDSSILTPAIATLGTIGYMAPEIYKKQHGRDADERCDIYSVGCLAYFVFSDGDDPNYKDYKRVKADVWAIIDKCTKLSPGDRYQNVGEVINELDLCQKQRRIPVSMKDLVANYRKGVNDANFADEVYRLLLTLKDDLGTLVKDLYVMGLDNFKMMLKYKKLEINNLISLLLASYSNNSSYWIQFEDVEMLVERARLLLKEAGSLQVKQSLLEFSINISKEYNRYRAMEIVGEMLNELSEEEMKSSAPFFYANKDRINEIKEMFKKTIPPIIRGYLV